MKQPQVPDAQNHCPVDTGATHNFVTEIMADLMTCCRCSFQATLAHGSRQLSLLELQ